MKQVGPARAGMIRTKRNAREREKRWPRTSGDDPAYQVNLDGLKLLAPHERG